MQKIIIYTDGGARGNPGPAGIGAVIKGDGLNKSYGEYIGKATNNEAEYQALVFALKKTKSLIGKQNAKQAELECFLDSELIVRQLNHQYKIENERMQVFFSSSLEFNAGFFKNCFYAYPAREEQRS